ncbi:MAG TPA: tetratricopeptide repeat protein [Polyangiaceae bacterium]|nr:tetratricopeptide repeat protein [Polyangiaceae bacterium]
MTPEPGVAETARARAGPALAVLAGVLGVTFGPNLAGEWVWDDVYLVRDSPALARGLQGLGVLWTKDLWGGAEHASTDLYHPVPMTLLAAIHQLAGASIVPYRIVNVLLHGAICAVFAAMLRRRGLPAALSAGMALLFAVHPLVTEPVLWVTGSHDLLGVLASLVAVSLAVSGSARPTARRGAGLFVATLAACLSKEAYFVLPALVAVAALSVPGPSSPGARFRFAVVPWLALVATLGLRRALGIATTPGRATGTIASHLVDYGTVVAHYGRAILLFDEPATTESYRPLPALAAFAVLGVLVLAAAVALRSFLLRREFADVVLLGVATFAVALTPQALATPIIGMYGNRYGYFPMLGLFAAASGLLARHRATLEVAPYRAFRAVLPLGIVAAVPFTLASGRAWRTEVSLFERDVAKDPHDARSLYHYAHALRVRSGCEAALPYFARSAVEDPGYARALHNVAGCLVTLHRFAEALPFAERAVELQPDDPGALVNLAAAEIGTGDPDSARRVIDQALRDAPRHEGALRLQRFLAAPKNAPGAP